MSLDGNSFPALSPSHNWIFGAGVVCRISGEQEIIPEITPKASTDFGGVEAKPRTSPPPYRNIFVVRADKRAMIIALNERRTHTL